MSVQYRASPTYNQPLTVGNNTHKQWWRWFQGTELGTPPAAEATVTVTASPFTYIAPRGGFVIVHGGTVSAISFIRTGSYATGMTSGTFPVSLGDQLKITYASKPTVTFVPT